MLTTKQFKFIYPTPTAVLFFVVAYLVGFTTSTALAWSPLPVSITARPLALHKTRIIADSLFPFSTSTDFSPFRRSSSLPSMSESSTTHECCNEAVERFRGQTVLLTGASGGLGRSLAKQMTRCGASTLILSARDQASLEKVAKECRELAAEDMKTINVHIITCDLSDPNSVSKLCQESLQAAGGSIDVLINNGGVSSRSRFLDTKSEVDELLMRINFLSGAQIAKQVVPGMVEKKQGTIIWISSVQGLLGIPNRTSYAASKFAVQGYCEALRAELASSGVTVHVASPGYIRTNLSRSAITGDGSNYGKMDETTANGSDPDEVAVTVIDSVAKGKADFVVAATTSAKAAIWLRFLAPSFLNSMLVKRFDKSRENEE